MESASKAAWASPGRSRAFRGWVSRPCSLLTAAAAEEECPLPRVPREQWAGAGRQGQQRRPGTNHQHHAGAAVGAVVRDVQRGPGVDRRHWQRRDPGRAEPGCDRGCEALRGEQPGDRPRSCRRANRRACPAGDLPTRVRAGGQAGWRAVGDVRLQPGERHQHVPEPTDQRRAQGRLRLARLRRVGLGRHPQCRRLRERRARPGDALRPPTRLPPVLRRPASCRGPCRYRADRPARRHGDQNPHRHDRRGPVGPPGNREPVRHRHHRGASTTGADLVRAGHGATQERRQRPTVHVPHREVRRGDRRRSPRRPHLHRRGLCKRGPVRADDAVAGHPRPGRLDPCHLRAGHCGHRRAPRHPDRAADPGVRNRQRPDRDVLRLPGTSPAGPWPSGPSRRSTSPSPHRSRG
jgi:hypothetical protein